MFAHDRGAVSYSRRGPDVTLNLFGRTIFTSIARRYATNQIGVAVIRYRAVYGEI